MLDPRQTLRLEGEDGAEGPTAQQVREQNNMKAKLPDNYTSHFLAMQAAAADARSAANVVERRERRAAGKQFYSI